MFFPENIGEEQNKKRSSCPQMSYKKNLKGHMLVSDTSAAAFSLARFRGLASVLEKRARVPSLARVPGVAHPWSRDNSV